MKILVFIDHFPPDVKGGYEIRCEEACYWLYHNGYQVEVITSRSTDKVNSHPFPVHRILRKYPSGNTTSEWPYIMKLLHALKDNYYFSAVLAKNQPDILYIWKSSEISRALIPKIFQTHIPKVVDISSNWFQKVLTQHGPVYRSIERREERKNNIGAKFFVKMLPTITFGLLPRHYHIDWSKLHGYFTSNWNKQLHAAQIYKCNSFPVFHTGVNLSHFPFLQKQSIDDEVNLLFVGRIEEDKGFYLLLNQLHYAKSLNFKLTVAGEFPSKSDQIKTEKLIKELGLEEKIVFHGRVKRDDLPTYYHRAAFTVFPSIWDEPFSRVPLESMACGTPCISTENPGCKEIFNLDAPLILLERSPDGLYKSIQSFLQDIDLYKNLSIHSRRFVEQYFTFERFMGNVTGMLTAISQQQGEGR